MLTNISPDADKRPRLLGELGELSYRSVSSAEYKYARGTEIFGAEEPAEYIYQVIEGAVRSHKLECANGRLLTQPPVAGSEPVVLKGRKSLTGSEGQIRCLPQPEQLHGLRAQTEQGRELDDGTKRFDCRRY